MSIHDCKTCGHPKKRHTKGKFRCNDCHCVCFVPAREGEEETPNILKKMGLK
jgi:hypothetical protein